jgi:hypothetical protein
MRPFVLAALVAVAASSRPGCGNGPDAYAPCAGKACGEPCSLCAPDDRGCFETADLKACDPHGRCVGAGTPFTCPVPDPCAGLACGAECTISLPCHFANPPCLAPQVLGRCDIAGQCVPGDLGSCTPHPDCVGKGCGDPCNPCGPDQVCPTFMASACDRYGRCVGDVPWLCDDPCAGKACGDPCDLCGGMCMHPYATECDRAGVCVPAWPGICEAP